MQQKNMHCFLRHVTQWCALMPLSKVPFPASGLSGDLSMVSPRLHLMTYGSWYRLQQTPTFPHCKFKKQCVWKINRKLMVQNPNVQPLCGGFTAKLKFWVPAQLHCCKQSNRIHTQLFFFRIHKSSLFIWCGWILMSKLNTGELVCKPT